MVVEVFWDLLFLTIVATAAMKTTATMAKAVIVKRERLKFKQEARMVFLNNFNQEKISWVKIDAEEAEYEILRGLRRTILEFAPKIV